MPPEPLRYQNQAWKLPKNVEKHFFQDGKLSRSKNQVASGKVIYSFVFSPWV